MSGLRGFLERLRALFGARAPESVPQAFGYADLRGGGSRIAIVPQLGGRISSLEIGGREWLWTHPATSMAASFDDVTSIDSAGGFDEAFPTSAACTIPSWIHRFGGLVLGERGDLRAQRPRFEVRTDQGPTAITTWEGERLPYELTRTARVSRDGAVWLEYRAVNRGKDPIPFVWSAQPMLPLTSSTRIVLPEGALARVAMQHGIELGNGAREQRWPRFRLGDRLVDMSRPDGISARFACKLFFDMPREAVAIEDGDLRLEITVDSGQVPNLGLWINRGGWPAGKRGVSRTIGLHPSIGAPDSLADALGDWKSAHWLAPDEAREWRLTFRARPLTSETPAARETPAESRLRSR